MSKVKIMEFSITILQTLRQTIQQKSNREHKLLLTSHAKVFSVIYSSYQQRYYIVKIIK